MGRPREYPDRVQASIRLKPELYESLMAAADERDVSVNWLMCKLLEESLEILIPVKELLLTRDKS